MSSTQAKTEEMEWKPRFSPWIIAITVMLATFIEVLDTSIANVALPNIAGTFSATNEEATWVLTSYLVSNAIILPTSAWFSKLLGRKKFLIICIIMFTISSFLCGAATSLGMLVFARILQGIGGGALQPISQAILFESFPRSMRGVASAVFGLGVVVAPIIGPTLGGWITENFSWQWVFYINIPIGIIAVLLARVVIEDPPYIKNAQAGKIDFLGFGFMAIGLATLQIILDKGQQADWFNSGWVCWFAVISALSLIFFIFRELKIKDPIVNLKVLANKNFAIGVALITVVGAVLYGTLAMMPLFLQNMMKYSAGLSGLAISPRGIGSFLTILIVGRIINKVDNRFLTGAGFVVLAISCLMLADVNFEMAMDNIIWPNVLSGVALGLIFIPLTTLTFGTLKNENMGNATGIFNLMRNIGGSIGIALTSSLITRNAQVHQTYMVSHLDPNNPVYQFKLAMATQAFALKNGAAVAAHQAQGYIYNTLIKQAYLWGFVDCFRLFAILCIILLPLIFLFEKVKLRDKNVSGH